MSPKPIDQLKWPHLKGAFACSFCRRVFLHRASVNRHRQKCINEHTCLICNTKIGNIDALRQHMNISHGMKNIFTCTCCAFTFETQKTLREHFRQLELTGKVDESKAIAMGGRSAEVPTRKEYGPGTMKRKSLSPSSSSSSASSESPTPVVTPRELTPELEASEVVIEEPMDEIQKMTSEIIGNMLDNGWYSDEQLVLPETWMKMIGEAQRMAALVG